ncbi:hypothetical protein ACFL0R_07655 [Pseudomonadota bacterium]
MIWDEGVIAAVLLIDASGYFIVTSEDEELTHDQIWGGFASALSAGNKNLALRYVLESTQNKYAQVIDSLMGSLPEIVSSFSNLKKIESTENMAPYVVSRVQQGQQYAYIITFIRNKDGVWKLYEM